VRRPVLYALAVLCAAAWLWHVARPAPARGQTAPAGRSALVAHGRALFESGCASCHGVDAQGITGRGPSLRGVGERAAAFYLSTGRMPLNNPSDEPARHKPAYNGHDLRALVAYVGSFGGPGIPRVEPGRGSLSQGLEAFTEHCAGCHQVVAQGGIVTGGVAPPLEQATPTQIAEAIRVGPYLMPRFSPRTIDDHTIDSIARYVTWTTHHPPNRGGWGIGRIGPIPEGMVAWLLGLVALLIVIRLIGERVPREGR
jgi:ubiquinol-cytochrome c reductase cytochrome c subunit